MHLSLNIKLKFYLRETQCSAETVKPDLRRAKLESHQDEHTLTLPADKNDSGFESPDNTKLGAGAP